MKLSAPSLRNSAITLSLILALAGCGSSGGSGLDSSSSNFARNSAQNGLSSGVGGNNGGSNGIGGPTSPGPGTGQPNPFVPGGGGGGPLSPFPPTNIQASTPGTLVLGIGDTEPLELVITLDDGSTVFVNQGLGAQTIVETTIDGVALTYESLDEAVVTIDENAILTGVGPGNTFIHVTATSGTEGNQATVELDVPVSVGVPNQFLYVANPTPNGGGGWIAILGIFEDGILGIVEERIDNTGRPLGIFRSPDGQFVYAVNVSGDDITPYAVTQGTGQLTRIGTENVPAGNSPRGLVFSQQGANLYAYTSNFNGNILGYSVGNDGSLTPLSNGFPVPSGSSFAGPTISPDGNTVYSMNDGSDTLGRYSVGTDGSLTAQGTVPAGDRPFTLGFSADGEFAYVSNVNGDNVSGYRVESDGDLTPLVPATTSVGDTPFSLGAHPFLQVLYVVASGDETVTAYAISNTGQLTQIDQEDSGPGPGAPVFDTTGEFMYIMRGDYEFSTYTIAADGTLTRGDDYSSPAISNGFARTGVVIDNTFNKVVEILGEEEIPHIAVGR